MSDVNIFEQASRLQLTFDSSQGMLGTEHLWQLPLDNLNRLAKGVNKQLKAEEEEDFLPSAANAKKLGVAKLLQLKLDILKHVIGVRVEEADVAAKRAARKAELAQLKDLAASKATEKLASQSLEDILAKIAELEAAA
jgi:hypothetical protein